MTEFGTSSTKFLTVNVGNSRLVSLMENLHKVGGSLKRLRQAETLLCVDAAKALFADCTTKQAQNFINYLDKHCDRIVLPVQSRTDFVRSEGQSRTSFYLSNR